MTNLDPQEKANIKMIILAFTLVIILAFMIVWMFVTAKKNHEKIERERSEFKELLEKRNLKRLLKTADSLETIIQLDTLDCGIIYKTTDAEIETQLTLQEVDKIRLDNGWQ